MTYDVGRLRRRVHALGPRHRGVQNRTRTRAKVLLTRVAALFYTLIESAKLAGVEPAGYLAEATRRAIANPGTVTLPKDLAGT